MINGPGWYPGARVVPLGVVHAGEWTMREVYADPATNEGSAFSDHVVLVWTTDGHTLRPRIPSEWLAPRDSGAQQDRSPLRFPGAAVASSAWPMYPDVRRQAVRLLAEIDAAS